MIEDQLILEELDGEIKKYVTFKEVKPTGSGGHVILPTKLIGKTVKIVYEE